MIRRCERIGEMTSEEPGDPGDKNFQHFLHAAGPARSYALM
jgi:hypothetical protein